MLQKFIFVSAYCSLLILLGGYFFVINWWEHLMCLLDYDEDLMEFDYIVVGAGTAGSVVTLRLSQDLTNRVLLLEAGPFGWSSILDVPSFAPLLHKSSYDWQYETVPQENACWAFNNNSSSWPCGKLFGGSGRINNMLYTRGHPRDFKKWYKDIPNFNYEEEIQYYFKKSERQIGHLSNDKYHGTRGPLTAADSEYYSDLHQGITEGVKSLNLPLRDVNGEYSTGFSPPQVNVKDGYRFSTAHHLFEKQTPNLFIRTLSMAKEILFKSNFEACGIKYKRCGREQEAFARKGVVITSGAVGTAKLLMLSGIGPKQHLEELGIEPKIDLPVGNNLQDHVATGFDLVLFDRLLDVHWKLISPLEALKYIIFGTGVLTSAGVDMLGFLNADCLGEFANFSGYKECERKYDRPDVEFLFLQAGISIDYGIRLRHVIGLKDNIWEEYYLKFIHNRAVSFLPIVLRPKSVGYVRLVDSNVESKPLINPNYLSHQDDINILLKGIRFIQKLVNTDSMRKLGAKFNTIPFPTCNTYIFDTEDYWRCYIKYMSFTLYHPVGTCKMGPEDDESSVVTRDFMVKSSNKLFVADASVFPQLISANTNAAVAMMAEKAADSIKRLEYLSTGKCLLKDLFDVEKKRLFI